jgi:outer membrane protein TolC
MRTISLGLAVFLSSAAAAAQAPPPEEVDGGAVEADESQSGSTAASPAPPAPEGPPAVIRLSLAECTARAVANSKELAAERHKLDALQAQVEQVWWAPFSIIGAEAGFSLVPDQCVDTSVLENEGRLVGCNGGAVAAEEDYATSEWGPTFQLGVKGVLPILDFVRTTRAYEAVEQAREAKAARLPSVEQQVRYDVERAYHAIIGAREMLYTLGEGKKKLVTARELLEKNLEKQEGTETETDLIKLKVFEAQIGFMEQQTRQIERTGLAALRFLVGGRDAARIDVPEDPQSMIERDVETLDAYKRRALDNRPELKALRHAVKALEAKVAMRRAEFLPSLGLVAEWRYGVTPGRTDIGNWLLKDSYNYNYFVVALALKYDFDLALDIYKLDEAKADLAALAADQENALEAVLLEVEATYVEVTSTRDSLVELEKSKRLAKGWIAAAVQANAAGLGPAKEVKDALKEYFQIMASIHKLTGEYNVGLAKLDKVTGLLGEVRE